MAKRPQVPGRPIHIQTPGPGPAGTRPGRHQARRHGPARPAGTGPDRCSGRHRSRDGSSRPAQSRACECDRACSGEPACPSSSPLGTAIIERLVLPKADGRFADRDFAGIPSNAIQHSGDWHDLPRPGRCCTQGALLSLDDVGSSGERTATLHPLCRAPCGWLCWKGAVGLLGAWSNSEGKAWRLVTVEAVAGERCCSVSSGLSLNLAPEGVDLRVERRRSCRRRRAHAVPSARIWRRAATAASSSGSRWARRSASTWAS